MSKFRYLEANESVWRKIGEFKGKLTGTRILSKESMKHQARCLERSFFDASLAFTEIISPLQDGNYS